MDDHDPIDDELTHEERAEAEVLARALERGSGTDLPEDALETAALLRYSAGEDALGDARMDAILDEVFESAKKPASAKAPSPWLSWLKWLVPVGALAAAGVFLIVVMNQAGPAPIATQLPAPDVALLSAQARVASQTEGSQLALASAMNEYRGAVLGSLSDRYGR
jgi:hypothetical protein